MLDRGGVNNNFNKLSNINEISELVEWGSDFTLTLQIVGIQLRISKSVFKKNFIMLKTNIYIYIYIYIYKNTPWFF